MSEEKDTPIEPNPFLEKLRDNQVAQARAALIQTVCDDPRQTIGAVLEALDEDDTGDYIMADIFKRLTLEELAKAVFSKKAVPSAPASDDDEDDDFILDDADDDDDDDDDDDLDDDDEFGDDGEDDDEDPAPKKKKKKKSKKKDRKDKKSKKKKDKKVEESGDSVTKKDIIACLRAHKAKDEDTAMSSANIRVETGGEADEVRALLIALHKSDKIDKCGEARGTKYFLM